jgi:putative membrane protein
MKYAAYCGALLGLALLTGLFIHEGYVAVLQALGLAGWALLWLVPYRMFYFFFYATGWRALLRPYDPLQQAGFGYLFWITTVREAVDRLLPVASVGGSVVGVRLLRWRGIAAAQAAATIAVEILLTVIVLYLFTALGLLLFGLHSNEPAYRQFLLVFLLSLPIPVVTALLLRYGSLFGRIEGFLRPLLGDALPAGDTAALDAEIRACFLRWRTMLVAGVLHFSAFVSGSFEIWFALRLFGHPVDWTSALALESMTQAVRHFAFIVPAGLGVQEAGLVLFGHALGIDSELALAVSLAKRMREVLCGLPPLLSWQWLEGRRLHAAMVRRKAGIDAP